MAHSASLSGAKYLTRKISVNLRPRGGRPKTMAVMRWLRDRMARAQGPALDEVPGEGAAQLDTSDARRRVAEALAAGGCELRTDDQRRAAELAGNFLAAVEQGMALVLREGVMVRDTATGRLGVHSCLGEVLDAAANVERLLVLAQDPKARAARATKMTGKGGRR